MFVTETRLSADGLAAITEDRALISAVMLLTCSSVLLSLLITQEDALFKCISGSKLWMAENFLKSSPRTKVED